MAPKRTRKNDNGGEGSSKGPKAAKKTHAKPSRRTPRSSGNAVPGQFIKCHIPRTKFAPIDEEDKIEEPAVKVRASRRSTANDDYIPSSTDDDTQKPVVTDRTTRYITHRDPIKVEAANPSRLIPAVDYDPEDNGGPAGDAGDGGSDGIPTPPHSRNSGSSSGGSWDTVSSCDAGGNGGGASSPSSSSSESSNPVVYSSSSSRSSQSSSPVDYSSTSSSSSQSSNGGNSSSSDSDGEELEIGQRYICNATTKKGGNCKNVFLYRGGVSGCHVRGHKEQ